MASSGSGLLPENGVWGHAPPSAFGRAAASPQTRQMRCWLSAAQAAYHSFPSLPPTKTRSLRCTAFFPPKPLRWLSAAHAAYHSFPSLPPTKTRSLRCTAFFPPKPLRWVSAGALLGEVIKLPFCIFSAFLCGGGITTLGPLWLCRNNPARGLFRQKNGFLRVGALCRRTRCSLLHTALFRRSCKGAVSLPSVRDSCC